MANGLEQEFPRIAWQVAPLLARDGLQPAAIREHLAHGRRLRSRAIRNGARAAGGVVARPLRVVARYIRGARHGLAERPCGRECWAAGAAPGA